MRIENSTSPRRLFAHTIGIDYSGAQTPSGVPTEVLAEAVRIEGSIERVAALYESSSSEVRDAAAFEQRLAA